MGMYRPLFSVSVGHGYFASGEWPGLDFIPTPGTMKVMEGADVLVRRTGSGVGVFYGEDRSDALGLFAADANGALRFSFKVCSRDRTFANYTSPPMRQGDAVLCFDNREAVRDGETGQVRLSKDEFASEKDFRAMDALVADGVLGERDRRVPPDFVVEILVRPERDPASGVYVWTGQDCYVNFNARRSFLRYFLLGGMNRDNLLVVDLDGHVEFEPCGEAVLPGKKPAKVFRSKEPIPVLEKSAYRFQLREQGQGGGRILIKRLPVASESRLGMDAINGKNEIVLDAYVNC